MNNRATRAAAGCTLASILVLGGCQGSSSVLVGASATSGSEATEEVRYVNQEAGYALTHPSDWREIFDANGIPVTLAAPQNPSGFVPNVGILAGPLPQGSTFAEWEEAQSRDFEETFDTKITSSERIEVAGFPAYLDRISLPAGSKIAEQLQWTINVDGNLYLITYTNLPGGPFEDQLPEAEAIVASFEAL